MKTKNILIIILLSMPALLFLSCENEGPMGLSEKGVWNKLEGSWVHLGYATENQQLQSMLERKNELADSLSNLWIASGMAEGRSITYIQSGLIKYQISINQSLRMVPQLQNGYDATIHIDTDGKSWFYTSKESMQSSESRRTHTDTIILINDETLILRRNKSYSLYTKTQNIFEQNEQVHNVAEAVATKKWKLTRKVIETNEENPQEILYPELTYYLESASDKYSETTFGHEIFKSEYEVYVGEYNTAEKLDTSSPLWRYWGHLSYCGYWPRDMYFGALKTDLINRKSYEGGPLFRIKKLTDTNLELETKQTDNENTIITTYYFEVISDK